MISRPALQHPGQERPHRAEHRPAVQLEGERPFRLGGIQQGALVHEAGTVEQDVDRAGALPGDRRGIQHVEALACGCGRSQPPASRLHVGGDDRGAGGGERQRGGTADALPGGGYERGLSG